MSRPLPGAKGKRGTDPMACDLEAGIDELARLPRAALVERWQALHHTSPPKGLSRRLLIGAVAYAVQARRLGGLGPAVSRRLATIAEGKFLGAAANIVAAPKLRPGARLIREWNGSTHVVDVIDGGYVWNGEHHRSLSAIARAITGARWSGPRFFGIGPGGPS